MDDTLVSVVISSFNHGAYVAEAIGSALAQRDARVEVVVVDDGSTDDSRRIIQAYGSAVDAVLQDNAGQAAAWNVGAARAAGTWTIFLDSDDRLTEDAAAAVLAAGRTRPTPSKVHWPMRLIDGRGESMGITLPGEALPSGDRLAELIGYGFDRGPTMASSGNAWHRRFLRRVLPIPEPEFRLSPDTYLLGLSPLYGPTAAIPTVCSEYRCHAGNNGAKGTPARRAAEILDRATFVFGLVSAELAARDVPADPASWPERNPTFRRLRAVAGSEGRAPLPTSGTAGPTRPRRAPPPVP